MIYTLIGLIIGVAALVVVLLFWVMTRKDFNEENEDNNK